MIIILCLMICLPAKAAEEMPSPSLQAEVQEAVEAGLVPSELQSQWKADITRREFCLLVITLLEKRGYDFLTNSDWEKETFLDTQDDFIQKTKFLGIVNGRKVTEKGSYFVPEASITRQEAAKMLYLITNTGVVPQAKSALLIPHVFNDRNNPPVYLENGMEKSYIAPWARTGIDFCYNAGVMSGVGNNRFAPNDTYTREQAIASMLRLYRWAEAGGTATKAADRRFLYKDAATGLYGYKDASGDIIIPAQYIRENSDPYLPKHWKAGRQYHTVQKQNGGIVVIELNGSEVMQNCFVVWDSVGLQPSEYVYNLVSIPDGEIFAEKIVIDFYRDGRQAYYQMVGEKNEYDRFTRSIVGYLDETGHIVIPAQYEAAGEFFEGVAAVFPKLDEKPVLINPNGDIVSDDCGIDMTKYTYSGTAWGRYISMFINDNTLALMDFEGNNILPPDRWSVYVTPDGNFVAHEDEIDPLGYLYDRNGKALSALIETMNIYMPLYGRYAFCFPDGQSLNGDGYARLCNEAGRKIDDKQRSDMIGDGGNTILYDDYFDPDWNNSGLAVAEGVWQIIIDDMGNELWRINAPEADFADGAVCVTDTNGIITWYTPMGIRLF